MGLRGAEGARFTSRMPTTTLRHGFRGENIAFTALLVSVFFRWNMTLR